MVIDRLSLVRRHDPRLTAADPLAALSVGNGRFAMTADITGLQTFADDYEPRFPLCILSEWGWHERPLPHGVSVADLRWTEHRVGERLVPYPQDNRGQEDLFAWMNENPHRLNLARLGFRIVDGSGRQVALAEISGIEQRLDLWNGLLESRFSVLGAAVAVRTCVHPSLDAVAVEVRSPLLASGQLALELSFPWHDRPRARTASPPTPDRSHPVVNTMQWTRSGPQRLVIDRQCDAMHYRVDLACPTLGTVDQEASDLLRIALAPTAGAGETATFLCCLTPAAPGNDAGTSIQVPSLPGVAETFQTVARHWNGFWSSGGAIQSQSHRGVS